MLNKIIKNIFHIIVYKIKKLIKHIPKRRYLPMFIFGIVSFFLIATLFRTCNKDINKFEQSANELDIKEVRIETEIENIQTERKEIKKRIKEIESTEVDTEVTDAELDKFFDDILEKRK